MIGDAQVSRLPHDREPAGRQVMGLPTAERD